MAPKQHTTDRGQGGWFRETRPHREAALKGKARPTHDRRASSCRGATSPPDQTDKRFLVFCDGVGSRSFDTPEEAKAFAKERYATRRYDDVEIMDQETEQDIARFE